MIINLSMMRYQKLATMLRETAKFGDKFLTKREMAALGCAAHRAEAEADLIKKTVAKT